MRGVKNSYNPAVNFWPFVMVTDRCWYWTGTKQRVGYGHIWRNGRPVGAHRISWELHNGKPVPAGKWVLHSCDNPNCVNPGHLFIGTAKDNHRDQIDKGRRPINRPFSKHPELKKRGTDVANSKLTDDLVLYIRHLFKNGIRQSMLAKMFNVDQSTISLVVNRKIWTHI